MVKHIKDLPAFQRPREKLVEKGSKNLGDEELLAIIFGSGSKKNPVLSLSKRVIKQFPFSRDNLPTIPDLKAIAGIGTAKACVILSLYELVARWSATSAHVTIKSPEDVVCHSLHIRNKNQEHLLVLYLDARSQLVDSQIVAIGRLNHLQLEPRDIFSHAFISPCVGIVLVHNHPSNNITPSLDDETFTQKMIQAGKLLGIQVLDHVIVSKDHHLSFKEQELIS